MSANILVADSGGSKTEWRFGNRPLFERSLRTQGLNPNMLTARQISTVLTQVRTWLGNARVDHLFFYGAGCGRRDTVVTMKRHLTVLGVDFDRIQVSSDLDAVAAVGFGYGPGTGAIIGTGSIAFAFDGRRVTQRSGGYGYLIGDKTGGITLGKSVLLASLEGRLPDDLKSAFHQFNEASSTDQILSSIYQRDQARALDYLARQTRFLSMQPDHPWVLNLLEQSLEPFIAEQLLECHCFGATVAIAGGLANAFSEMVIRVCSTHSLDNITIIQDPLVDELYKKLRERI